MKISVVKCSLILGVILTMDGLKKDHIKASLPDPRGLAFKVAIYKWLVTTNPANHNVGSTAQSGSWGSLLVNSNSKNFIKIAI